MDIPASPKPKPTRAERRRERFKKRGSMKYLKDGLFLAWDGKPLEIDWDEEGLQKGHPAKGAEFLRALLSLYHKNHQTYFVPRNLILGTPAEIGGFNRARTVLRGEPQEAGAYRFETEDWKALERVARWAILVSPWYESAEELEALLASAVSAPPKNVVATDGLLKDPVPEKVVATPS